MSRTESLQYTGEGLEEQLKRLAEEYGFIDPVALLIGFANGKDLRSNSLVYEWVLNWEREHDEDDLPDVWEWDELLELIKNEHRFLPVERGISKDAAKTLIEYQHNKRKAVEISDKSGSGKIEELTKAEIRRFERVFNNEY